MQDGRSAKFALQKLLVQLVFVRFFKTNLIFRKGKSCFEMLLLPVIRVKIVM